METRSGRDLASNLTAEQSEAREEFLGHLQAAAELQQEMIGELGPVQQKWARTPPVFPFLSRSERAVKRHGHGPY